MKTSTQLYIVAAFLLVVGGFFATRSQGEATNSATNAVVTNQPPSVTKTNALPKLMDFGAGKCIPCKMMMPILQDLKKDYVGRMKVEFVDVWLDPDAGKPYGIEKIPTQIFFDASGKELYRHEGFFSKKDILAKWKSLGVNLGQK